MHFNGRVVKKWLLKRTEVEFDIIKFNHLNQYLEIIVQMSNIELQKKVIEALNNFGSNKGGCLNCDSNIWMLLDDESHSTVLITAQSLKMNTYTLVCANCGSIRQFIRSKIDEKIKEMEERGEY